MLEHDTAHHTDQTSGSMESSSRPGPQRVKPAQLTEVALFEGPPLFSLLVSTR